MILPKTAKEIENEIFKSSDQKGDLRLRQLIHILTKVNHETIVEGVINVFENLNRPDNKFRDQECAGQILQNINPKSDKDLEEILRRTLKNWDKSVEQLPFWLRDNYGLNKVKDTCEGLQLTPEEKEKLDTMKWWLQLR